MVVILSNIPYYFYLNLMIYLFILYFLLYCILYIDSTTYIVDIIYTLVGGFNPCEKYELG